MPPQPLPQPYPIQAADTGAGCSVSRRRLSRKLVQKLTCILVNYSDENTETEAGKHKDVNRFGCSFNVDLWTS